MLERAHTGTTSRNPPVESARNPSSRMTKKVVGGEVSHCRHSATKLLKVCVYMYGRGHFLVAESCRGLNIGEVLHAAGACQASTLEPTSKTLSSLNLSLNILSAGQGEVYKGSTFTFTGQAVKDTLGGEKQYWHKHHHHHSGPSQEPRHVLDSSFNP